MQKWSDDLEWKSPAVPQRAEEPHDSRSFDNGTSKRRDSAEEEDLGEECVTGWVASIQNDGHVRPEFSKNIEAACEDG